MPKHTLTRNLPYSPRQLFDMVADIEAYPEFLPWCKAARILQRDTKVILAELLISFKVFRESYTSRVELIEGDGSYEIQVQEVKGPFSYLNNRWKFIPDVDGGTVLTFDIDFEFRSKMLGSAIGVMFDQATLKMVSAFEVRARELYGPV